MPRSYNQLENPDWIKVEFGQDHLARTNFIQAAELNCLPKDEISRLYGFTCLGRSASVIRNQKAPETFFGVALFEPPLKETVLFRVNFTDLVFPDQSSGIITNLQTTDRHQKRHS